MSATIAPAASARWPQSAARMVWPSLEIFLTRLSLRHQLRDSAPYPSGVRNGVPFVAVAVVARAEPLQRLDDKTPGVRAAQALHVGLQCGVIDAAAFGNSFGDLGDDLVSAARHDANRGSRGGSK